MGSDLEELCPFCGERINPGAKKCRHCQEWLDAAAANADALSCPWCAQSSQAAPGPQTCGGCRRVFWLFAGPRLDPARRPPGDGGRRFVSRTSGVVVRRQAELTGEDFAHGILDPVTGFVPMSAERVPFAQVASIALWSRPDWVLLVGVALFALPISALLALGATKHAFLGAFGAPVWLATAFLFWRALGVGAHSMRVCSAERTLRFRYDAPFWRRAAFRAEALRRCGVPAEEPAAG